MDSNKRFLTFLLLVFMFACSQPYSVDKALLSDTGIEVDPSGNILITPGPEGDIPPASSSSSGNVSSSSPGPEDDIPPASSSSSSNVSSSGPGPEDDDVSDEDDNNEDIGSSSSESSDGSEDENICDNRSLGNYKVDVCHDGHTININVNAWCNAHSKHEDDYLGKCVTSEKSKSSCSRISLKKK